MPTFDIPENSRLTELATWQHGVVSAAQLADVGVSRSLTSRRVSARRWQRPHAGVYALVSGPLDRRATIWAAILRCGDGAVASHQTAAELDQLSEMVDQRVHITVDERHRRVRGELKGIVVHLSGRLPQARHPARTPPRTRVEETVVDLVDNSVTARKAADWILAAVRKRLTTPARLATTLAGRKKIRWRALADAMLADAGGGAHSALEQRHLDNVERAHGLPSGTRQHRRVVGDRVIYPDKELAEFWTRIELDGLFGHQGDDAFRDRQRDNRGAVDGMTTLRYGHADVFGTPCAVAAEEAAVIQDRGWASQPRKCGVGCEIIDIMATIRASQRRAA